MTVASACPNAATYERLRLGQLASPEVERLAQHLEQCPTCATRVQGWKVEEVLMESLRIQTTPADRPEKEVVSGLIARLKRLPATPGCIQETTVSSATAAPVPLGPVTEDLCNFLAPPQGPGEIGRLGGYRVRKLLGAGGMGMVYHAEDVQLQRPVALKVMKPEVAKNPTARERFLREARAAAGLRSDHVVTIHQVGEAGAVAFLAMEYLEGLSLDDWLRKGHRPTTAQAARIGRQIALGLAAAHERGLIHRDVKPANVWLDSAHQGRVKLLDFGLARPAADDAHLTQSGTIVGTPAYMAPEQARGEKVDHRADLYSLGVVLYRLTTGRLPFQGDNAIAVLTALMLEEPKPPREVNPALSPRLAALIERLMAKKREQRPATARAVADELAAIEREPAPTAMLVASPPKTSERAIPMAAVAVPAAAGTQARSASDGIQHLPSGTQARSASGGIRRRTPLVAAGLLVVLAGVAAAIVVIIRDRQGKEVARVPVPEGGSAVIQDEGKERPAPKKGVRIEPEPLPPLAPGEPLGRLALVARPTPLPGVRSWSIATRHMVNPYSVAYRPDGKRLAVGSWDFSIRVWEPQSGRLVQVLFEEHPPFAMGWSPDGRVLAVGIGVAKRCLHLWDAETGRLLRSLEIPANDIALALAWSPDGGRALGWGPGGWGATETCYTWDVVTGKLLHAAPMKCAGATFSPDGKRLAGIVDGKRLVVWDTQTGKEAQRRTAPAPVWSLAWSPDGKRLAWTGEGGLRVWDLEADKESFHHPAVLRGFTPAWSPDGRTLAYSLDGHQGVALLEAAPSAEARLLEDGGGGLVAWSPDGKELVRTGGDSSVRLYDSATGKRLRSLTTEGYKVIEGFAWSPDGKAFAVTGHDDTYLVAADTGRLLAEMKGIAGPVAWSPDGKHLATTGPNNTVLLRGPDGKVMQTLDGHSTEVTSLAWSPDGKRLASTAAGEKRVALWDVEKAERAGELGPFAGAASKVKWSADGRLIAFDVADVGWHVWDREQNKVVNDPKQWKAVSFDLAPDGRSALVAPAEREAYRLRDLATGKEGARLPHVHASYLAPPAWSPDGRLLAAIHHEGTELWRPDLRKRLRSLQGKWPVGQIAFSRDGKLVAGLTGERLYLWETDTGRLRGVLLLGPWNHGLTLTPDGHYTGNARVDRGIVVVVQKTDGTQELLEPADFEKKYGFKNDPDQVHLLRPLPP
jgi:serine/threonine protein kinase/WD40 repeat protein